jgi:cysteine-rich repeat protein
MVAAANAVAQTLEQRPSYADLKPHDGPTGRGSISSRRTTMRGALCGVPPCPTIRTILYGIDLDGSVEVFAFDTGSSVSIATPGDLPFGADGLAVAAPDDAFWVSSFGTDEILEFSPIDGSLIAGAFPMPPPGTAGSTDGLAVVEAGRLFSLNFADDTVYEIDTATGATVNALLTNADAIGGLAGGVGRLFAVLDFTVIGELDPETGTLLNTFAAPDLSGDGFPDQILGLAFDGKYLFAASASSAPPNVAALDPATGDLLGISPFEAPSGTLSALDAVAAVCGDEVVSPSEECDDGNLIDGDGCDSSCTPTGCGNGIGTEGEACDEAGQTEACDEDCTRPQCGDSDINEAAGEACDDGNIDPGDGCGANCRVEICRQCVGEPSLCTITQGAQCFADGNTCEPGVCNSAAVCTNSVVLGDGARCEDGSGCSVGDRCRDGACVAGALRDCRSLDGECTTGVCDDPSGQCRADGSNHEGQPCDDGLFCTVDDVCQEGACVGVARDCSELDDACSIGACNESAASCVAVTVVDSADCSDENPCTDDLCDPDQGCVSRTNALPCDDDDSCTVEDHCTDGECRGEERSCDDRNTCTFDQCDTGFGCHHAAILSACSDINRCTADDTCLVGRCVGEPLGDCTRVCGDATGDGLVTVIDALAVLRIVVTGGVCDPVECDVDSNRRTDTTDVLFLLRILVQLEDHGNCPEPDPTTSAPEIEPNDSLDDATSIACPFETVGAEINPRGDVDFYSMAVSEGDVVAIDIDARDEGSSLDSILGLLGSNREILVLSDDDPAPGEPFSLDSYLEFEAPATATYFIGVTSCCDFSFEGGSGLGNYTLRCRQRDVSVTTTLSISSTTLLTSTTLTTRP